MPSLAADPVPPDRRAGPRGDGTREVPGHNRWHPDIPAVAEVITGGSVRMECRGREPGTDPVLCGPLVVVGAEPGDVIVVDVLGVGRSDGLYAAAGHPGVIGCAPSAETLRDVSRGDGGASPQEAVARDFAALGNGRVFGQDTALLGGVRPGLPVYGRVAAEAVRSEVRGREIGGCAIAPLTAGSRILLPVHVLGAKLSVGDLHFPERGVGDCRRSGLPGWIDLRINLTRRGVERFRVTGPMLMSDPSPRSA